MADESALAQALRIAMQGHYVSPNALSQGDYGYGTPVPSGAYHQPLAQQHLPPQLMNFLAHAMQYAPMAVGARGGIPRTTMQPPKEWAPEFIGPPREGSPWAPQAPAAKQLSPIEEMFLRAEQTSRMRNGG